MKKLFKYISVAVCVMIFFLVSACSNTDNDNTSLKSQFVGIAIFQNSIENNKWDSIKNDKSLINNIIETKNDKIIYNSDPAFLFYVYSQSEITSNTQDSEYISNTTRDRVNIVNDKISFTFERIAEETDVLIYFIYKDTNGYYLKFVYEKFNINSESETILLNSENETFDFVELNLKINISVKEEY